jgi:chaperonin GroES
VIQPISNKVLVELQPKEEMSKYVFIPEHMKKEAQIGTVLAAGPGKRDKAGRIRRTCVVPGDKVLIGEHGGTWVDKEARTLIVEDEFIWAIIKP